MIIYNFIFNCTHQFVNLSHVSRIDITAYLHNAIKEAGQEKKTNKLRIPFTDYPQKVHILHHWCSETVISQFCSLSPNFVDDLRTFRNSHYPLLKALWGF